MKWSIGRGDAFVYKVPFTPPVAPLCDDGRVGHC
jgi:hypothetical protein